MDLKLKLETIYVKTEVRFNNFEKNIQYIEFWTKNGPKLFCPNMCETKNKITPI